MVSFAITTWLVSIGIVVISCASSVYQMYIREHFPGESLRWMLLGAIGILISTMMIALLNWNNI